MKPPTNHPCFPLRLLVTSASLLMLSLGGYATTTFTGLGGDTFVTNPANWDNGLPDNIGNSAIIPDGSVTWYTSTADLNFNGTWEGNSTLSGPNARIDDGVLTFRDSSTYNASGVIALARDGGTGIINVSDSATVNNIGDMKVGRVGTGTVNQTGGTINVTIDLELGNDGGTPSRMGLGFYNLSGGTASVDGVLIFANASAFDFTTGSTGVLEVGNGGGDYTSAFEGFITGGQITLGGAAATTGDFQINFDSGVTSLQLIPEPSVGLLALLGITGLLRRRR